MVSAVPRPTKTARNTGIDLLRCLTTLGIVMLHFFNQGGIGANLVAGTGNYYFFHPLSLLCYCTVNIYALISGYVETEFKPRRYFALWLQVVSISAAMCLLGELLAPGSVPRALWLQAFLPVSQKGFWYFSAYTGLFCLLPLLQAGLNALSRKGLYALAFGLFFGLFGLTMVGQVRDLDPFALANGYSCIWLVCLYLLGACLHRTQLLARIRARWLCLALFLSLGVLCASRALGVPALQRIRVYSYANPLHVINAVCLLTLFSRCRVRSRVATRLVGFFAPLTFGVYIIHVHDVCYLRMTDCLLPYATRPLFETVAVFFGSALALYLLCSLADWVRQQVFRLCRVPRLCAWAEMRLQTLFDRLAQRLP